MKSKQVNVICVDGVQSLALKALILLYVQNRI